MSGAIIEWLSAGRLNDHAEFRPALAMLSVPGTARFAACARVGTIVATCMTLSRGYSLQHVYPARTSLTEVWAARHSLAALSELERQVGYLQLRGARWSWLQLEDAQVVWRYLMLVRLRGSGSLLVWGSARALRVAAKELVHRAATAQIVEARAERDTFVRFLIGPGYLSQRMVRDFQVQNAKLLQRASGRAGLISTHDAELSTELRRYSEHFDKCVREHNDDWVAKEEVRWAALFDTVERTPLTREQRKAVIVFDDRNLLVAAAGSGKSSTVVAKVAYALSAGLYEPGEILVLTFNRKAAQEIKARLSKRLSAIADVKALTALTFDALARRMALAAPAIEAQPERRIIEVYRALREQDPAFAHATTHFIAVYTPEVRSRADFDSYQSYLDYVRSCGRRRPVTLRGEEVASLEELKIANWLFSRGIAYEYEKSYPHAPSKSGHRGYTPDFYYPEIDTWHEHFGIDARGRPARCVGDPDKYLEGVSWKRGLHAAHGSVLLETTSAMFSNGCVFEHLEEELRARGQTMLALTAAAIDAKLGRDEHDNFARLIATFIANWKQRRSSLHELEAMATTARDRAFLAIAARVLDAYVRWCAGARKVEFTDVLAMATEAATLGHYRSPYRFILVDEFQDMSEARAALVRALLAQHEDGVLFGVGDDWQAINGFAGSEVGFMTRFEAAFGAYTESYLTQTFRSCQGLADTARTFVEKNPSQRRKSVIAADPTVQGCVEIRVYRDWNELPELYQQIARELADAGPCTLHILGRYNKNLYWEREWPRLRAQLRAVAPNVRLIHSTVHKAKGLEADYVVVDRVELRGSYAFPSTLSGLEDSVLRLVRPTPEAFPHAEERRLMYVALTRARKRVYILTSEHQRSPFVSELMARSAPANRSGPAATADSAGPCPYCKRGERVWREKQRFWGCSDWRRCAGPPPTRRGPSGRRRSAQR